MVTRILTGMIENGLLDHPMPDTPQRIDYAAHADVAQRTAEAGIVLLKNAHDILPLAKTARRVVLIGGHADVGVLSGGGSSQVRSVGGVPVEIPLTSGAAASFARITYHASSPLDALRALMPGAQVRFVDGSDPAAAAAAARDADVAIVFATQWQTEAQDAETLVLPDRQDALIDSVAAANPRTVVVLETGGPVLMPWIDRVQGVVEAWYPGQRGGQAIAAILVGSVNPSGRLPITFPRSAVQAVRPKPVGLDHFKTAAERDASANTAGNAPEVSSFAVEYPEGSDVGYRWYASKRLTPLFAFGHGLSYSKFNFERLTVTGGAALTTSFEVVNRGRRAGAVVPQLYVARDVSAPRLTGFKRVFLRPGERKRITLIAEPRVLADWEEANHGWHILKGTYAVIVSNEAGSGALVAKASLSDRRFTP
ncbi:glycoside hydrolase family 3 C-terminal domain-containing protein [Sphingomonas sp. PAMC 26621]|uniref:glycoside hydrolase family 3 C-terminal domain-containing protein n=1 Tax=Sphingomonas sp. PAMC 26621 TaxID=1112213 RepID=UPI00028A0AB2